MLRRGTALQNTLAAGSSLVVFRADALAHLACPLLRDHSLTRARWEDLMQVEAQIVTEPVARSAREVFTFASRLESLPAWASAPASGIEQRDGQWIAHSPMGDARVELAEPNAFGVLDHDVTLSDSTAVHNAFRVTPAATGSLLCFIVVRLPGASFEAFEADVAHVGRDLKAL